MCTSRKGVRESSDKARRVCINQQHDGVRGGTSLPLSLAEEEGRAAEGLVREGEGPVTSGPPAPRHRVIHGAA